VESSYLHDYESLLHGDGHDHVHHDVGSYGDHAHRDALYFPPGLFFLKKCKNLQN